MYEYRAKFIRALDGDTIEVMIDLGLKTFKQEIVRLRGLNTVELTDPDDDAAFLARELMNRVASLCRDKNLILTTTKDRREKFGRMLAVVVIEEDGTNINDLLLTYPGVNRIDDSGRKIT